MSEGKVKSNGIELWYEDFGDPSGTAVLLIMGAGGQGIAWPMELINPIVEAGFHVVRFDNRDIGYSTWIEDYKATPYTIDDMATDAVGLMDALNIENAHIVGVSMGGMIAQLMAIKYPNRVLSLTSWMSTYWILDPDVPAMTEAVGAWVAKNSESPPVSREQYIENQMELWRLLTGSRFPFDEEAVRIRTIQGVERAFNPNSNHGPACQTPSRLDALRNLNIPTLVIHGDEDPIINYCHGVVCAKVIPGATLLTLRGIGHELPLGIIPEASSAILKHICNVKQ